MEGQECEETSLNPMGKSCFWCDGRKARKDQRHGQLREGEAGTSKLLLGFGFSESAVALGRCGSVTQRVSRVRGATGETRR